MHKADSYHLAKLAYCICDKKQWSPQTMNSDPGFYGKKNNLQQLFTKLTKVDYINFTYYLQSNNAKDHLLESRSIIAKSIISKLLIKAKGQNTSPHITCITTEQANSMTKGLVIKWATVTTLFGKTLMAVLGRNLCALFFIESFGLTEALIYLRKQWPGMDIQYSQSAILPFITAFQNSLRGNNSQPPPIVLKGTIFQVTIWKMLMQIPDGLVLSYSDLACFTDRPKACRAVGTAVGRNPISYLIPCHRIINASGTLGQYHWGTERKRAMLAIERARYKHQ